MTTGYFAFYAGNVNDNRTIPGGLDECELNTPTAITVNSNNSIMVATLKYHYGFYDWDVNHPNMWEIPTKSKSLFYPFISIKSGCQQEQTQFFMNCDCEAQIRIEKKTTYGLWVSVWCKKF